MIRTAMCCDTCDAVFVPEHNKPYGGLAQAAHEDGWNSTCVNGKWSNACPECSAKEAA